MLNISSKKRILLVGFESVGKTSLFACLTENRSGEESNVKGSTIFVKEQTINEYTFVDTPGLRLNDNDVYDDVKNEMNTADHVFIVIRGTHYTDEVQRLMPYIANKSNSVSLVITFADRMTDTNKTRLENELNFKNVPVTFINSRRASEKDRELLISSIDNGISFQYAATIVSNINITSTLPTSTWFDRRIFGPFLSILFLILLFCIPIVLSYHLSKVIEVYADQWIIDPLSQAFVNWPDIIEQVFVGNYGLFTLGLYSFIWAFPVVLLISIASAITDDSGIKDRIVDALDPLMRRIGLNGQDLVPIITGFGCNVVAVHQTRACSSKTRNQCVSIISFGSACSYQIGATLSVFHVANMQWLFIPYLFTLTIVGALHNKVWYPIEDRKFAKYFQSSQKTFLQKPSFRGVYFRVKSVILQFITQAMPIFLVICIIAALLDYTGVLTRLTSFITPLMKVIGAPEQAGSGIIFSLIRKDGILLFNEGNGELLASMTAGTIFLLVYLASTLSSCLVTLITIAKELKSKLALSLIFKQFITSILSAGIILILIKIFSL